MPELFIVLVVWTRPKMWQESGPCIKVDTFSATWLSSQKAWFKHQAESFIREANPALNGTAFDDLTVTVVPASLEPVYAEIYV